MHFGVEFVMLKHLGWSWSMVGDGVRHPEDY